MSEKISLIDGADHSKLVWKRLVENLLKFSLDDRSSSSIKSLIFINHIIGEEGTHES